MKSTIILSSILASLVLMSCNDCYKVDCPQEFPPVIIGIVDQDSVCIAGIDSTFRYNLDSISLSIVNNEGQIITLPRSVRNTGYTSPQAEHINLFDMVNIEVTTLYLRLNSMDTDTIDFTRTTIGGDECCNPIDVISTYSINNGPIVTSINFEYIEVIKN